MSVLFYLGIGLAVSFVGAATLWDEFKDQRHRWWVRVILGIAAITVLIFDVPFHLLMSLPLWDPPARGEWTWTQRMQRYLDDGPIVYGTKRYALARLTRWFTNIWHKGHLH